MKEEEKSDRPRLLTQEILQAAHSGESGDLSAKATVVEHLREEYWQGVREEPEPASPLQFLEVLCFELGGKALALHLKRCRNILRSPPLGRLPGDPPGFLGIFALRGEIIPVLDLASLLGLVAEVPASKRRLIMLTHEGETAAIEVDRVEAIRSIPMPKTKPGEIAPVHPEVGRLLSVEALFEGISRPEASGRSP